MRLILLLLLSTVVDNSTVAATIIPITPGMTWQYNMTQETGEGVRLSDAKPDVDEKIRSSVSYRLQGPIKVDRKELLKFEMHRDGAVTNTDLVTVNDQGITCFARVGLSGETIKLDPPQIMIQAPLKTGASWDFEGKTGAEGVRQHYAVIDEEEIDVPAGTFHAFHIHGEQSAPNAVTIDRWFADDVGIVKDVTTTRSPGGDLLRRISLELKEPPKVTPRPEVKPAAPAKKLTGTVSRDPIGQPVTDFSSDTPKIYARWQGRDLQEKEKIRVAWIAEDIGEDAPHDYTIDEATTLATAPFSYGVFVLARPEEGWAPGNYRVEFYVDDELVETVKLKIAK